MKTKNWALAVEIHIYVFAHCFDFLLCGSQATLMQVLSNKVNQF